MTKNPIYLKLCISNSSISKNIQDPLFIRLENQENLGKTAGKSLGSFIVLDRKKKIPGKMKQRDKSCQK